MGKGEKKMITLHVTDHEGICHVLKGEDGARVSRIIKDAHLKLKAECDGALSCGTCHVYVQPWWMSKLDEKSAEEEWKLDQVHDVTAYSRLSCQIRLQERLEGLEVVLAQNPD